MATINKRHLSCGCHNHYEFINVLNTFNTLMKIWFYDQIWKLMQQGSPKYYETICFCFGNLNPKDYNF